MSNKPVTSSIRRFLGWSITLILVIVVGLSTYVFIPVLTSPADGYHDRKGKIQSVNITKRWREARSDLHELELVSSSGLKALVTIRIPEQANGPLPVALLLGGVGTGRDACRIIPEVRHIVCVSISYPYQGSKSIEGLDFFYNIREIQKTVKDTPPALMLALDYVLSQPYSDIQQVELIGVSFGAYFISIPAVLDKRVTRVWIAHGAAQPVQAIIHYSERDSGVNYLKRIVAYYIGYAIGSTHVDPGKWVNRISPRPVMLINAENDRTFSPESVAALHNAARQPKKIFWTRGEHITPSRHEVVDQLSSIVVDRIESDYLQRRSND